MSLGRGFAAIEEKDGDAAVFALAARPARRDARFCVAKGVRVLLALSCGPGRKLPPCHLVRHRRSAQGGGGNHRHAVLHAADRLCQSLWFGRLQPDLPLSRHGRSEEGPELCVVLYLDGGGGRAALRGRCLPVGAGAVSGSGCKRGYLGVLPSVCLLDGWHWRGADCDERGAGAPHPRRGLFQTGRVRCGVRR